MAVEITAEMISEDTGKPVEEITVGWCCNYNELRRKIDAYLQCLYTGSTANVELWESGQGEDCMDIWYAYAVTGVIDMKIFKKGDIEHLITAIGQERSIYPIWLD